MPEALCSFHVVKLDYVALSLSNVSFLYIKVNTVFSHYFCICYSSFLNSMDLILRVDLLHWETPSLVDNRNTESRVRWMCLWVFNWNIRRCYPGSLWTIRTFLCVMMFFCVFYHLVGSVDEWSSQPCVEGSVGLSQCPSWVWVVRAM